MKHPSILVRSAIILASCAALSLTSCTTKGDQRETLTGLANTALAYGVITGEITPQQAALVREGGALVLDFQKGDLNTAGISSLAVAAAVEGGQLTPEQAAALKAAGTVPLATPAADPAAGLAGLPLPDGVPAASAGL